MPRGAQAGGNASLELQWSTPIFAYFVDPKQAADLNRKILDATRELRASSPKGETSSNRHGWQSPTRRLHKEGAPFSELKKEAVNAANEFWRQGQLRTAHAKGRAAKPKFFVKEMWINVLGSGGSHKVHKHAASIFAGVYYASVPAARADDPEGGSIKFRDPRSQTSILEGFEWMGLGADVQVRPSAGLMLVFPGWLDHFVEPVAAAPSSWVSGPEERVAVSFNFGFKD